MGVIENVNLLLDNVAVEGPGVVYTPLKKTPYLNAQVKPPEVYTDTSNWKLTHSQVVPLKKLYYSLGAEDQKRFKKTLHEVIRNASHPHVIQAAVYALAYTGNIDEVVDQLIKEVVSYSHKEDVWAIDAVSEILMRASDTVPTPTIEKIHMWLKECFGGKNKLGQGRREHSILYDDLWLFLNKLYVKVNIILVQKLKGQIEANFNPEINADEDRVREEIRKFGFPKELEAALDHISELLEKADDEFDFSDCMKAIRTFDEKLTEYCVKALDPQSTVSGIKAAKVAEALEKQGVLSHDGAELLKSLRYFLSNDGTHTLTSLAEDARLSKNMLIEFSLYLLQRLGEVKRLEEAA